MHTFQGHNTMRPFMEAWEGLRQQSKPSRVVGFEGVCESNPTVHLTLKKRAGDIQLNGVPDFGWKIV